MATEDSLFYNWSVTEYIFTMNRTLTFNGERSNPKVIPCNNISAVCQFDKCGTGMPFFRTGTAENTVPGKRQSIGRKTIENWCIRNIKDIVKYSKELKAEKAETKE